MKLLLYHLDLDSIVFCYCIYLNAQCHHAACYFSSDDTLRSIAHSIDAWYTLFLWKLARIPSAGHGDSSRVCSESKR